MSHSFNIRTRRCYRWTCGDRRSRTRRVLYHSAQDRTKVSKGAAGQSPTWRSRRQRIAYQLRASAILAARSLPCHDTYDIIRLCTRRRSSSLYGRLCFTVRLVATVRSNIVFRRDARIRSGRPTSRVCGLDELAQVGRAEAAESSQYCPA
jgi:hypothetical protein